MQEEWEIQNTREIEKNWKGEKMLEIEKEGEQEMAEARTIQREIEKRKEEAD